LGRRGDLQWCAELTPDKQKTLGEMFRVLRAGGRLQIGDILVSREVPEGAKKKIDLWTG
jgi:arsenite methyltransferase